MKASRIGAVILGLALGTLTTAAWGASRPAPDRQYFAYRDEVIETWRCVPGLDTDSPTYRRDTIFTVGLDTIPLPASLDSGAVQVDTVDVSGLLDISDIRLGIQYVSDTLHAQSPISVVVRPFDLDIGGSFPGDVTIDSDSLKNGWWGGFIILPRGAFWSKFTVTTTAPANDQLDSVRVILDSRKNAGVAAAWNWGGVDLLSSIDNMVTSMETQGIADSANIAHLIAISVQDSLNTAYIAANSQHLRDSTKVLVRIAHRDSANIVGVKVDLDSLWSHRPGTWLGAWTDLLTGVAGDSVNVGWPAREYYNIIPTKVNGLLPKSVEVQLSAVTAKTSATVGDSGFSICILQLSCGDTIQIPANMTDSLSYVLSAATTASTFRRGLTFTFAPSDSNTARLWNKAGGEADNVRLRYRERTEK